MIEGQPYFLSDYKMYYKYPNDINTPIGCMQHSPLISLHSTSLALDAQVYLQYFNTLIITLTNQ